MRRICLLAWLGMVPVWAGEIPGKAADYHAALLKRPESAQLFERFRDAWLEERSTEELEKELLGRAEGKEAGAWAALGRAYLAAGRTEKALEAFDQARKQAPAAWLDLETARLRLTAKDFAAAEKDALAVPEADPLRLDAVKLAGLACLRAERIDDALAHWTKAVAAAPGDNGLLEDLTELTRREGRFDLALDYCGKWRDATNDAYGKAMATLRRSELLLGSQRFDEAMTELAAVLKVSADDSWLERETIARAEQAHRQRGNATGWAKWIGAQADGHPARLNFRRAHSQALAAAGKTDEALEVLTEVMRRSPGDTTVRWQRIGLLEQSMKLAQAYDECAELAAKEKSEAAGLRLAELAFRLEKKDELKRALDGVLAAAEPGKRVALAGLYARYGLPEGSERIWREEAGGELGGQALRQLAKHLKTAGREKDANEVWKQLGAREVALDRIEAAQMLAAAGERGVAREILESRREKFSTEPGYEAAVADLAMMEDKADEARAIYLKLAKAAKQPDELTVATKGWLRTSATLADPVKDLGEETAGRCLRAAWLAAADKPLPAVRDGDAFERSVRMALLREHGRWTEVVAMMEAVPGERGPLLLSELAEAKTAAGDLPGALGAAQAWRGRVPDQAGPWLFEAGTLEKLNKQADATVLLRRAAARFEDNEEVARRLFAILQEALDPRESLEWAWKRHDRSQDEAVRSGWLREILQVSKQREILDDLKERFEERARRDPASPGPLVALAELAKARGESREELDLLRRAAINAPRDTAVISALAALEERSGEPARALERHITLARLAPGPDSARQLAQAKIRLGDIEGGMRDLQALAGEKGIDLRALEQSAGDLASRGYVEEATRMLAAVDPAQRTARLYFILGMLLDIDGREREAVDAFIKVMAEPDDPAESRQQAAHGYDGSRRTRQYSQMFQYSGGRDERIPGVFNGLQVPESLVGAKMLLKARLSRLAMEHGGEIWEKAAAVVPELAVATPEQWREAMDFAKSGENRGESKWWDFIQAHPANPLGIELLVEGGQYYNLKSEQVDTLLKTNPPLRTQIVLRWGKGDWRADNLEFLESIRQDDWQDKSMHRQALWIVERMFSLTYHGSEQTPVSATECARAIAVLEKAGLADPDAAHLELLRARLALLEDSPDEFVRIINAWAPATRKLPAQQSQEYGFGFPVDAIEHWRKKAGDKTAEALIARIESPVLRCYFSRDPKPGQRLARVNRELAALPKDAPVETRRALVRLKWSFHDRGEAMSAALRKELETAANGDDPRLAVEARMRLIHNERNEGELVEADRANLQELANKLMASPDPEDREFAEQFSGYAGRSSRQAHARLQPAVTRWGSPASFSSGNSSQNRLTLPAIIAMNDKDQAVREAARFLENVARASGGQGGNLGDEIKSLSAAGLLDGALDRISLPPDAGLGRRVAIITLLDACAKTDMASGVPPALAKITVLNGCAHRARSLLAEIAKSRPWETRWTVDLALRSADDAEMRRLLDSVVERGDFDRILGELLLLSPNGVDPDALLTRLTRLVDWAPQAKGRRAWMETAMMMLANGGHGGLQSPATKNKVQLGCFLRYVELALDDRRLGELGFRMMFATSRVESPEATKAAARRALLSGAYTSDERTFASVPPQDNMALAALEHLVLVAEQSGDDAAFPAEFRERLKAVDPDTDAWLAKMLAAKTVSELPGISNVQARSSNWVALARHEAAMLRAIKMPGREAWLTGVFRESKYPSLSQNLQYVIRESLMNAAKTKGLQDRVIGLLEAAAGPRKDWGKDPKKSIPGIDPFAENAQPNFQLSQVAALILEGATKADAVTLLAVLDIFRDARVPVSETHSVFNRLGQWWQAESRPPRKATLAELLGKKREAPYTLGVWISSGDSKGKLQFLWALPQMLQNTQLAGRDEIAKSVKDNPDAGFPDLLQAWIATHDKTLQRRALLKAAPDLAKLPEEIRRVVIAFLIADMQTEDVSGLPAQVMAQLRENLDAQRKQRVAAARRNYASMKSGRSGSANESYQIGALLGPVIGDDEAFVNEVLTAWRLQAEADKSAKEIEAFLGGLISGTRHDLPQTLIILRLYDSLSKGSPPPAQRNSNWGDPMESLWRRLGPLAMRDPQLWRETAKLSPKMQAQFWLRGPERGTRADFGTDPKLVATLREAAKGSEITRAALEWCLQYSAVRGDGKAKVDGAALIGFTKALKDAGATADNIAPLLIRSYSTLARMDNPGALMAETPALLDELKNVPNESTNQLFQGVQNLWEQVQRERRTPSGATSETALPVPVYPMETAALLKFALNRGFDPSRSSNYGRGMTPIILAIDDADLLALWIKVNGKSLVGDLALIIALLEKDRVAEAMLLAPAASRGLSSRRQFNSHLESIIAKLGTHDTPQAFGLRVQLLLQSDAVGAEAPHERYPARRDRLTAEFERFRGTTPPADRAAICLALGLSRTVNQKHVPALDEFASEAAAKEFQKLLVSGESGSTSAKLFVPAVCSRVFVDDLSGISLLAAVIAAAPPGSRSENMILQYAIDPVYACLVAYASKLDAKLSEAAVDVILTYAKTLADRKRQEYMGIASQLVYIVTKDAVALGAGLKHCGLEGVKPIIAYNQDRGSEAESQTLQTSVRVALLHPTASEALLESLGAQQMRDPMTSAILPSLQEPELRARISPALFLKWNRQLRFARPKDLEAMELYATERREEFDEAQRTELDGLLKRLQDRLKSMDPARVEEMRKRGLEEDKLRREQQEKGQLQDLMRRPPPH
ncbi:MAG: hypothetical protein V4819_06840 [Verrucomicrobiota bacterium]